MNNRKVYLENLDLFKGDDLPRFPPRKRDESGLETLAGENAVMNFKSLNSFVAGVSQQRQQDVLNSFLLAQRAAAKSYPNYEQIADWYKKYFEVLNNVGWVFQNNDFASFKGKSNLFEIDNALLEILSSALTGNQLTILIATLKALKSLGDGDKRFVAFEKNTHSLQQGNFQLGVATEENNTISIAASAFILNSSHNITKILFFKSSKDDCELKFSHINATLNDSIYKDIRESIIQKLGDVSSFIADLEI